MSLGSITTCLVLLASSFLLRNVAWFVIEIISMAFIASYAFFNPKSKAIILYLVTIVVAASVAPIISLGFTAGEADQMGYLTVTQIIIASGHISSAQAVVFESQYYATFPILNFLASAISIMTGLNPLFTFAIMDTALPAAATIAIIYVVRKLTGDYFASTAAVMILLATDRLAFWDIISQNLSIFFALFALVPMVLFLSNPSKLPLILTILLAGFSNFVHAEFGGLFLISFSLIGVAYLFKKIEFRSAIISASATLVIMLGSYWTIWNISTSVGSSFQFIFDTFLREFSGAAPSAPIGRQSLLAITTSYAFLSWAVPVAIAASYIVYKVLSNKFEINNRLDIFLLLMTIAGLILLIIGLSSTYGQGSLSLERYSDVPGYTIFMITSSVVVTMIVRAGKKLISVFVIGLLIVSLALGGSQLNWAPDQFHSSYSYATQQDYYASRTIINLLPTGIAMYSPDNLQYIFYWNTSKSATFLVPTSLQIPINSNRSASFNFLISYLGIQHHAVTYLILGSDQILNYNATINSPQMDTVYSDRQSVIILGYT
ncbi:MAG: hypothetical protein PXY39_14835 [archaeon]|nr:hypothetical protein [archaeon]